MARSSKAKTDSTESLQSRVRLLSRQLEIEAALEKVRSRAMSMRSSDMLAETSAVMFRQIQALGIDATRCFNAKFESHLDHALPKINVVPQDIGRVVLNLINDVSYAVSEKLKAKSQKKDATSEPTVIVSTKSLGNKIEISMIDNGPGIPGTIKDKIFQPFLTTKATGQGTGRGLSLSSEIIPKVHDGHLHAIIKQGEGPDFAITLTHLISPMRKFLSVAALSVIAFARMASGQNMDELQYDKLIQSLREANADSTRALTHARLAEYHRNSRPDSTLFHGEKALMLSRTIQYPSGEAKALSILSHYHFAKGELPKGLELGLEGLKVARHNGLVYDQASSLIRIANVYANLRDFNKALTYYREAIELTRNTPDKFFHGAAYWRIADAFAELNDADSALYYGMRAEEIARSMGNSFIQQGVAPTMGFAYGKMGQDSLALHYLRMNNGSLMLVKRAMFFYDRSLYDSAVCCAQRAFDRSQRSPAKQTELASASLLSELYEKTNPTRALAYLKIANAARESISGSANILSAKAVEIEQAEREAAVKLAEIDLRNRLRIYLILAGLALTIAIALLINRNYRKAQQANALLEEQKREIQQALSDLKKAQSQLIQSEKMASLGELTAGIAHEIKNPLNFVNNFSEVSKELLDEMKQEMDKGNNEKAKEIASDVIQNLEKVVQHGQRADGIVKSMLQHSRKSSGQKELTDINALCDEYLRLAYHGLRAKDKSFNAKFETHLDPNLPKINVVPQDIGRVVLNLINNAFYACTERSRSDRSRSAQKPIANSQQQDATYEPTVIVSTKSLGDKIEISVSDNGPGIPDSIKDKIFQPFFTTKPTGQGTGLGLSLSYDIVEAHGGKIKVNTKEGENGTEFTIQLQTDPLS